MSYTALYRKFRPASFDDVKGQDHIVTTLRNQIQASRLGHAYLFCGTRGTGKTTVAKIFARAVNCENPQNGSACGECPTCKALSSGMALNIVEIDAASNNGVENVRTIIEEVSYSPTIGKYKVYIIDEAHMITPQAFNALLKTLEEPPEYVIFILATTDPQKILTTILSRCQRYDFHRITIDTIKDRLEYICKEEGLEVEDKALRYLARMGDGSMRDALSLLDQCVAFHLGEKLTYDDTLDILGAVDASVFDEVLRAVSAGDVVGVMELLERVVEQGRDLLQFTVDLIWYLRCVMLIQTEAGLEDVIDLNSEDMARLKETAGIADRDSILRYIYILSEFTSQIRYSTQKRVLLEVTLIRLCRPEMDTKASDILLAMNTGSVQTIDQSPEGGEQRAPSSAYAIDVGEFNLFRDDMRKNTGSLNGRLGTVEGKLGSLASKIESIETRLRSGMTIDTVEVEEEKVAPIPEALKEDVQELLNRWRELRESCDPIMLSYLDRAERSVTEDGRLALVCDRSTMEGDFSFKRLSDKENMDILTDLIAKLIGKKMDIEVAAVSGPEEKEKKFPDISSLIKMDIVDEDEPDEGFGIIGQNNTDTQ